MRRFEEQDKAQPPSEGGVMFIGSSSIRLWKVDRALPDHKTVNRGFGGSTIADVNFHLDRILGKRQPQVIVFYSGDNDIAQRKTAEQVAEEFGKFFAAVQKKLPQTDVVLVLGANDVVNPSARDDPSSPIYGMPILNVDRAGQVVVVKRSLSPGFAGLDNPLFYDEKTQMFFADAKEALEQTLSALRSQ